MDFLGGNFILSGALTYLFMEVSSGKTSYWLHDDVIKWKHFLRSRCWPFVRGIRRWPVNFSHKGQWRRALMFYLVCTWINGCVNNHEAGDLRRHRAHYHVTNGILSSEAQGASVMSHNLWCLTWLYGCRYVYAIFEYDIKPSCAEYFIANINVYLQFISFLHTDMTW